MNLVSYAESELNKILKTCKDSESLNTEKKINDNILNIVKLFAEQHHTGLTAHYCINILMKLLNYRPLSPLTGNEDEWLELNIDENIVAQNIRCPEVFKDSQGRSYITTGKVFSEDEGHTWFTNKDSKVYIEFPYEVPDEPERIIINNKVERSKVRNDIKELIELYNKNITNVDDEDEIGLLVESKKLNELETELLKRNNKDKIQQPINKDDKIYQVITKVLNEDEE